MGILSKMNEKAIQEWADNLTLEQIEDCERKGMDMSEHRVIFEEKQRALKAFNDSIALDKLDIYKNGLHLGDPFVEDVAKFNNLSEKKKPKLEQAELVWGKVVQAHYTLFKANPKNKDGAGIVFLYAKDAAHRYDIDWLNKTVDRIAEMRETFNNNTDSGGTLGKVAKLLGLENNFFISIKLNKRKLECIPEDNREFIGAICEDSSRFCLRLGASLVGDAEAWCGTYALWDQSKLPGAQIPENRIIPLLLTGQPEGFGGIEDDVQLIPPEYYMNI